MFDGIAEHEVAERTCCPTDYSITREDTMYKSFHPP